jgi:hypothetical protein
MVTKVARTALGLPGVVRKSECGHRRKWHRNKCDQGPGRLDD